MSGGHFDYNQFHLSEIADAIHELIISNHVPDESGYIRAYPEYVIEEFKKGVKALRRAAIYTQRIDYLLSGDDGEASFMRRLIEDLAKYEEPGIGDS